MPTRPTRDLSELAGTILSLERNHVIGIDGLDGSGKMYLAQRLAPCLNARHINLDDFLNRNEGGFLNHLQYENARGAATAALNTGRVIVEGDCLRTVFERLGLVADLSFFVKHVTADGIWFEGDFLTLAISAEEVLAMEQKQAERFEELYSDTVELGQDLIT